MAVSRHAIRVILDMWSGGQRTPPWEPFHPFNLAPGAEASIEMEATVQHRIDPGSAVGITADEIHFSVLDLDREAFLPLSNVTYFAPDPNRFCSTVS